MPFHWHRNDRRAPASSGAFWFKDGDPPAARLTLWPHRSLPAEGFALFICLTAAAVALPLLAVLGTPVLWGLLPFLVLAVSGIWLALRRSYRDGRLTEELTLWHDRVELVRRDSGGAERGWSADPHWVRIELHEAGGPVEKYLTMKGGGREVEIGAFLSPEERLALRGDLQAALASIR